MGDIRSGQGICGIDMFMFMLMKGSICMMLESPFELPEPLFLEKNIVIGFIIGLAAINGFAMGFIIGFAVICAIMAFFAGSIIISITSRFIICFEGDLL